VRKIETLADEFSERAHAERFSGVMTGKYDDHTELGSAYRHVMRAFTDNEGVDSTLTRLYEFV
jgi:hypothetical protein